MSDFVKNNQYRKFCAYGFLKNLRFFDAFFILFFLDKGVTYTQIGFLYALREITINLFEVPSGIAADTLGRKRSLVFALVAYIVSFITFYYGQHFYVFLFAMFLYGIGDAFRSGTNKGMIMDYLRMNGWNDQKVNYYGHTRSWSQRGSAISSLLAGLLVFYSGNYQYIFLFALLPYLLNLINILSYPDELNFSSKSKKLNQSSLLSIIKSFLHFVRQKQVLSLMNSAALHSSFMKSLKDYIQPLMLQLIMISPFLTSHNLTRRSGLLIGVMYFFIYLMTAIASKNAHKLLNIGPSLSFKTLIIGLMCGVLSGIFYAQGWYFVALICFICIYLIENLRKPILTGELADQVAGDVLTSVLSVQSFMQSLFTIILSICFGLLADRYSVAVALFSLTSILILYSLLLRLLSNRSQVHHT